MNSRIEIVFAGQQLMLDASGALYWPAHKLLVVSDLHLEKSTFLAHHGSLIPPYDTLDTLDRLEALIAQYQPQELLLLGDSFHDRHAWDRLDEYLRARIAKIGEHVPRISWIEGNHDAALIGSETVQFLATREITGLIFSHEYETSPSPQIIGHYHPKMSLTVRGNYVRGKCFAHTSQLLIMPAFGSYTGGLDIEHEVFKTLTHGEVLQPYLLHHNSIYKFN